MARGGGAITMSAYHRRQGAASRVKLPGTDRAFGHDREGDAANHIPDVQSDQIQLG
jgi:hypothetical protein